MTTTPTPEPAKTRAKGTSAAQWREAAAVLRKHAAIFDQAAVDAGPPICGVISLSGPNGEPLACGWKPDHHDENGHSWASLPSFSGVLGPINQP